MQHERVLVTRLHVCMAHASMMGGGGGCKPTLEFKMILLVAGCGYMKAVSYSVK